MHSKLKYQGSSSESKAVLYGFIDPIILNTDLLSFMYNMIKI